MEAQQKKASFMFKWPVITQKVVQYRKKQYEHQYSLRVNVAHVVFLQQCSKQKIKNPANLWGNIRSDRKMLNQLFSRNEDYEADDFLLVTWEKFRDQPLTKQQIDQAVKQLAGQENQTCQWEIYDQRQNIWDQESRKQISQESRKYKMRLKQHVTAAIDQMYQIDRSNKEKYIEVLQQKLKKHTQSQQINDWKKFMNDHEGMKRDLANQLWVKCRQQRTFFFRYRVGNLTLNGRKRLECQFCPRSSIDHRSFRRHIQNTHYTQLKKMVQDWQREDPDNCSNLFNYVVPIKEPLVPQVKILQNCVIFHIQQKDPKTFSDWYQASQILKRQYQYVCVYDVQIQKDVAEWVQNDPVFLKLLAHLKQFKLNNDTFGLQSINMDIFIYFEHHAIQLHASVLSKHGYTPRYQQQMFRLSQLSNRIQTITQNMHMQKSNILSSERIKFSQLDCQLKGRSTQIAKLSALIQKYKKDIQPSIIHVSGPPGTGKTTTVKFILNQYHHLKMNMFNCFSYHNSSMISRRILFELTKKKSNYQCATQTLINVLKHNTSPRFIVLDEADHIQLQLLNELKIKSNQCHFILITNKMQPAYFDKRCELNGNQVDLINDKVPFRPYLPAQIYEIFRYKLNRQVFTQAAIRLIYHKSIRYGNCDIRACLDIANQILQNSDKNNTQDLKIGITVDDDYMKLYYNLDERTQDAISNYNRLRKMALFRMAQLRYMGVQRIQLALFSDLVNVFSSKYRPIGLQMLNTVKTTMGHETLMEQYDLGKTTCMPIMFLVEDWISMGFLAIDTVRVGEENYHDEYLRYSYSLNPIAIMRIIKKISGDKAKLSKYIELNFYTFDIVSYLAETFKNYSGRQLKFERKNISLEQIQLQ